MGGRWMPRIVWIALGTLGGFGLLGVSIPDMRPAALRLALVALGGGAAALLVGMMAALEADGRAAQRERQPAISRGRRRRRGRTRTKRRMVAPVG